jgi:hypothetical protein
MGASSMVYLEDASHRFYGDYYDDQVGYSSALLGDVDGDGLGDVLLGAPGRGVALLFVGGSYGPSIDATDDYDYWFSGSRLGVGTAVSGPGDVDGDGYDDMLIGAYGSEAGGMSAGAAYVVLGGRLPLAPEAGYLDDLADDILIGAIGDHAGRYVSGAGDVDGDGLDDLLISATGMGSEGGAYLALASSLVGTTTVSLPDNAYGFEGESDWGDAGEWVSGAGDVDNDGLDDLLIGAPEHDYSGTRAGKAYLILGNQL